MSDATSAARRMAALNNIRLSPTQCRHHSPAMKAVHLEMRPAGGKYKLSCSKTACGTRALARQSIGMAALLAIRAALGQNGKRHAMQNSSRIGRPARRPDRHAPCRDGDRRMDRVDARLVRRRGFRRRILRLCRRPLAALGRRHAERCAAAARRSGLQPIRRPRASRSGCIAARQRRQRSGRPRQAGVPDRAVGAGRVCRTGQAGPGGAQRSARAAIRLRRFERGAGRTVLEHDPENACPGLDPGWPPVSRLREARCGGRRKVGKDHAQSKHASRHTGAQQIVEMHDADRPVRFHDDERRDFR